MKLLSFKIDHKNKIGFAWRKKIIDITELQKYLISHKPMLISNNNRATILPEQILNIMQSNDGIDHLKKIWTLIINNTITIPSKYIYREDQIEFLPPIPNPPLIYGIVGNSAQYWRNKNLRIVDYPIGFIRPITSLSPHQGTVVIPKFCTSFRYGTELGVIIGKKCKKVSLETAMEYVFGYTCVNDMVSDRWKTFVTENTMSQNEPHFMEFLATSYYSRSTNGFCPTGPYLVSKDEIPDPYNLLTYTRLSGETVDRSYSNSLIQGIEKTISFLSQFMTIPCGALIHMGTMGTDGFTVPQDNLLGKTDYLEVEIEKIGKLKTFIQDERK